MKTAATQRGRVSKTVNVYTDAAGVENLGLRFTVDVRMPIEALPSYRFSMNTIEGRSSKDRILLRRTDGKKLVIRTTATPPAGVTVTAEPVDGTPPETVSKAEEDPTPWGSASAAAPIPTEPGDVWLEMEAEGTLAAGRYSDVVRLATNDPEAAEIQIPYTIRVRPLIDARPATVRLWTAPTADDRGRSAIVTLSHYGSRKFSITGLEVSNPEIFTAEAYSREPSTQQTIRTSLVEGLDPSALDAVVEGWIRVTTNDPERPVIEVPVLVAPSQALSRRAVVGER